MTTLPLKTSMLSWMVLLLPLASGCAHIHLKRNTIRQANTVSDIYEQQVLDNLAKFVVNAYATPSFSVANQSTSGVTDQGTFGVSDEGFTARFWEHVSIGGSRDAELNFTFTPVTNPGRLQLMQCAYQRAVGLPPDQCNKCCEYLAAWTGNPDACNDPCGVTSGWICTSDCRSDVPKCCCNKYGKYCGTYVWVEPCHENEFSTLVMAIIGYAAGDPAPGPATKAITLYLDSKGRLTAYGTHAQEVRAVVRQDATLADIEASLTIAAEIKEKEERLWSAESAQSRAALEQQIAADRMRQQAIEARVAPSVPPIDFGPPTQFNGFFGGGILQLQQRLNTVPSQRFGN